VERTQNHIRDETKCNEAREQRAEEYAAYHTSGNKYTLYRKCTEQKVGTNKLVAESGRIDKPKLGG